MIENQDQQLPKKTDGVLGRLVDESGELKEPSHCIIQYGGRVRLPDKLIEILNKEFQPESMWWQPDGECFAFDSETVQKKILDVWFRGTKLTSFIRSLNRWGFRRVFYHALPESALAFHHASFRKSSTPEMLKSMKMSKSGKASGAIAANTVGEQGSIGAPLPATVFSETLASPVPSAPQGLSALSQLAAAAPLSPTAMSASLLPQLPLSNTTSTLEQQQQQQQQLLKLLSEQRNRDLLALTASTGQRASLVMSDAATSSSSTSTLHRALLAEQQQRSIQDQQQQQQQLLLLARAHAAGQELLRAQEQAQQRQQTESALKMALLTLKSRQNPSLF